MRAKIIAAVDQPGEVEAAEAWLAACRPSLAFVSDDSGCGCCVHVWDVEGPAEVLASIPAAIRAADLPGG